MPVVAINPVLRNALAAYMEAHQRSKAKVAAEFQINPMTLGRFLQSGRVIDANRRKLEEGLARAGAWAMSSADDPPGKSDHIVSNDKVIDALEFLLAAARQHDRRMRGGEGER